MAGSAVRGHGPLCFLVVTSAAVAAALYYVLMAIGDTATWTKAPVDLWVSISGLNFIGAIVILHAVLWRRSPIPVTAPPAEPTEQETPPWLSR